VLAFAGRAIRGQSDNEMSDKVSAAFSEGECSIAERLNTVTLAGRAAFHLIILFATASKMKTGFGRWCAARLCHPEVYPWRYGSGCCAT
jgi:hypothetical protein